MAIDWQQVGDWIVHNIVQLALILSIFIQIVPIKINPWSSLFKWIGKLITQESDKKIEQLIDDTDKLRTKIEMVQTNLNENEKDRIRWEILDFANSCRNGKNHTKDEFEHIVTLNKKYKNLLTVTNDENGVFEVEYEYIKELYAEKLKANNFLGG